MSSKTKAGGKIKVSSSTSPLGGGSVRVYVGDTLVWRKNVKKLSDLIKLESKVKILVYSNKSGKIIRLRLV